MGATRVTHAEGRSRTSPSGRAREFEKSAPHLPEGHPTCAYPGLSEGRGGPRRCLRAAGGTFGQRFPTKARRELLGAEKLVLQVCSFIALQLCSLGLQIPHSACSLRPASPILNPPPPSSAWQHQKLVHRGAAVLVVNLAHLLYDFKGFSSRIHAFAPCLGGPAGSKSALFDDCAMAPPSRPLLLMAEAHPRAVRKLALP